MKLHQKGFLLVELSKSEGCWDSDLITNALHEYELSGRYWINNFSVTLDELSAAGLITCIENRLDDGDFVSKGRLMFKYQLTEFGRTRMQDTGLLAQQVLQNKGAAHE